MTLYEHFFEPLEDNPRYIAATERLLTHFNEERSSLRLEPVDINDPPWQ